MKIYQKAFSFLFLVFAVACVFLAKHFNIFSVFSTKPKARRGLEETEITDMEFSCDDIVGGSKRIACSGCW
jgi:hypothetical protein